jgi:NAD-dependent deacetylase
MRPNVVLFGEALPEEALDRAAEASHAADLFIVLGSSLLVSPANYFPQIAKAQGAKLVIVNHDPTPMDDVADMVVTGSIRDTLEAIAPHL